MKLIETQLHFCPLYKFVQSTFLTRPDLTAGYVGGVSVKEHNRVSITWNPVWETQPHFDSIRSVEAMNA